MSEDEQKLCNEFFCQAFHNERLVSLITNSSKGKGYFYWAFVCLYYAAIHYFNAFLIYKNIDPPNKHEDYTKDGVKHLGRLSLAKNELRTWKNDIGHVAGGDMRYLYNLSRKARYEPSQAILLNMAQLEVAKRKLDGIKYIVFNEVGFEPKPDGNMKAKVVAINLLSLKQRHENWKKTLPNVSIKKM
ncbi:MAG: hypothetical protein KBC19_03430 [Candidatus Moranbacteria bacterium]|jgi:hypothetical protein|nr:hypothetical protein [Candidatus Moranbacteria bacterium]